MQDNQWDEQFRDHAWQEMRRLLDRELPVAPPRRRRGFAWIFLAALLLLGGGAYVLWTGNPSGVAPPATGIPAAEFSSPSQNQLASEGGGELPVAGTGRSGVAAAGSAAERRPLGVAAAGQAEFRYPEVAIAYPLPGTTTEDTEVSSGEESEAAALQAGALREQEAAGTSFSPLAPGERGELKVPQSIELLSPEPLRYEWETNMASIGTRKAGASFLLPRHWGLRTAGLGGNGQLLNGAGLGVIAEYPLGRSRWSLRSGLEYLYLSREMKRPGARGNLDLAAEDNQTPSAPGTGNEDVGTGGSYAVPLPTSLRYASHALSVPLSLQVRLGRRFELGGGAQLLYSFHNERRSMDESLSPNSFGNVQDRSTLGLFYQSATAALDPEVFRRFDVALTGSLHYRLGRRWKMELAYHHGLRDLAASDYYEAYNRFGSLGVVYFLR